MRDSTARRLSTVHRLLFRATGGVIGRRLVDNDMLLLETTGRRTGKAHTVPLLYLLDGINPVVIASWGGRPSHPEWFHNLVVNPSVMVQIRTTRFDAIAKPMAEPERSEWWHRATAAHDGYVEYQDRTDRIIPIVRLVRAG